MPQIGWSELLVIAVLAILIIGPKDFPIVMNKIGSWLKTIKVYASSFRDNLDNISDFENDNSKNYKIKKPKNKKKIIKKLKNGSNNS